MLTRATPLLAALLLPAVPAAAQSPEPTASVAASEECETDFSAPLFAENDDGQTADGRAVPSGRATPAEERVQAIVAEKGVHVVRLWAPWCSNSTDEMERGWDRLVADNEDVTFTFVTVWNNGNGGAGTMRRHGLSLEHVTEVVPAKPEQGRLGAFMGYALDWVPSTWVFRTEEAGESPERAFAMNYGEMERATLQTLIDTAGREW